MRPSRIDPKRKSMPRALTAVPCVSIMRKPNHARDGIQISKLAAASTIPVTSAVAQANNRTSFRILVIAAPCVHGTSPVLTAAAVAGRQRIKMEIPPTDCKTLNGRFGSRPTELDFVLRLFVTPLPATSRVRFGYQESSCPARGLCPSCCRSVIDRVLQFTVGRELPFTLKPIGASGRRSPRPRYRRCRSDNRDTKGPRRIWAG